MSYAIHPCARTTPAVRREIQQSDKPIKALAREYRLNVQTVRKWKRSDTILDRSHRPRNMHTALDELQEYIVVELRKTLLLSLDDLLFIVRSHLYPDMSRSALDRLLRRHGVNRLNDLIPREENAKPKPFKHYKPGFVHVDIKYLPQMPDESGRRYLFVAIDRASRWVYLEVKNNKSAASANAFLKNLIDKAPFVITKILTDNGKEFTDRFASKEGKPGGRHLFDRLCAQAKIEHRLIRPGHPQTNGMVERFNGRIAQLLKENRYDSRGHLEESLLGYMQLYNHHIPQRALDHKSPVAALKEWREKEPELFRKKVYQEAGRDI